MYRIDNATAQADKPTPQPVGVNPNGYFFRGDPSLGTLATIVDDDWLNAVQEELCEIIEAAGITLSKTTEPQLLLALNYMAQRNGAIFAASTTSANTYTATLATAPLSYTSGMGVLIQFTNANTGAATINLNTLGAIDIKRSDGSALLANDIKAGMVAALVFDGTNFQIVNSSTSSSIYATSSTSPNTYTASLQVSPGSYTAGMQALVQFTNANTGTATINFNSLGAKSIKRSNGSALVAGDISAGMIVFLVYDGTNFQMTNYYGQVLNNYAASTSSANTYTASLAVTPAAYTAGMQALINFTNANTGAATINLNSLGAKSITRNDGTALVAGDIQAGMIAYLIYDGTNFQLMNRYYNFACSLASSGYQVLPSGLIMQWGLTQNVTVSNTSTVFDASISFPISFPNACLQVVITDSGAGDFLWSAGSLGTSSFEAYVTSARSTGTPEARYFAIGY